MIIIIKTVQIREEIYNSFISHGLFPEKQTRCHKGTTETEELLQINQHILEESEMRQKNVAVVSMDYKKHSI